MRKDNDSILAEKELNGILHCSESSKNANMYYLTGFLAPDPFIFIKKMNEDPILIVNQMEFARAEKESRVKDVRSYSDYDFANIVRSTTEFREGIMKFVASVAKKEFTANESICISPDFSVMFADYLRRGGVKIRPTYDVVEKARETKDRDEVEAIKMVQRAVKKRARALQSRKNV